jgi:hypothetical protein
VLFTEWEEIMGYIFMSHVEKDLALRHTAGKTDPESFDEAHENILHGISLLEEREARPISAFGCLFLGEFLADAGRKEAAIENMKNAEAMYLQIKVIPESYWPAWTQEALEKLGSSHGGGLSHKDKLI